MARALVSVAESRQHPLRARHGKTNVHPGLRIQAHEQGDPSLGRNRAQRAETDLHIRSCTDDIRGSTRINFRPVAPNRLYVADITQHRTGLVNTLFSKIAPTEGGKPPVRGIILSTDMTQLRAQLVGLRPSWLTPTSIWRETPPIEYGGSRNGRRSSFHRRTVFSIRQCRQAGSIGLISPIDLSRRSHRLSRRGK
jgi:hypothetical protein